MHDKILMVYFLHHFAYLQYTCITGHDENWLVAAAAAVCRVLPKR